MCLYIYKLFANLQKSPKTCRSDDILWPVAKRSNVLFKSFRKQCKILENTIIIAWTAMHRSLWKRVMPRSQSFSIHAKGIIGGGGGTNKYGRTECWMQSWFQSNGKLFSMLLISSLPKQLANLFKLTQTIAIWVLTISAY